MTFLSAVNALGIAVTLPFNVRAGQRQVVASGAVTAPVLVYGATDDTLGGVLTIQSGGAVIGSISFFGAGGEVDDATGAANAYHVYGGGGVLRLSGAGSSATFANTQNDWASLYGDDVSVALQGAQVNVYGADDVVTLSAGEDDCVSLHAAPGQWSTVQGDGGLATLASGNASVLGAGNSVYAAAGSWLSLYQTHSGADHVYASATFVILTAASADVTGGGDALFANGPSALTLDGTAGNWDGVFGAGDTIALNDAQASIFGGGHAIAASAGSWMSLYQTAGQPDSVTASGANVILTDAAASVAGGGDVIYALGACALTLTGTGGAWDTLTGTGAQIFATQAEVSIFGAANDVAASNAFVSLYATAGQADSVTGANDCLALTDAQATLTGSNDSVYMFGNSALTLLGGNDAVYADTHLGNQSVAGFSASDVLHLAASQWTDFAALLSSGALAQNAADATVRLDASHVLTLQGVTAANLTAAQFAFG